MGDAFSVPFILSCSQHKTSGNTVFAQLKRKTLRAQSTNAKKIQCSVLPTDPIFTPGRD